MLKTTNLFRLGLQCCRKCQSLQNTLSTCAMLQKRESITSEKKFEILAEERKRYEDTFGDIDKFERTFAKIQDDPEDIAEYERMKQAKGKTLNEYKKEISELLLKHQYKEAINVLEIDMVNDKIKSDIGIYRMLFNYTALKGDLDEAYRLYVRYRGRQGRMTGPMYSSLFNACANSKNSFSALKKAEIIRENLMQDKFHKANIFNYNAMLKAFGRHGDVPTCLKIFDEVLHKRLKAFTYTYNFLLQSCISDRNAGLRHALLIWKKMIQSKRQPDIFFFNLFLRCVRDCSLGDVTLIPDLIEQVNKESGKFFKKKLVIKKGRDKITKKIKNVPVDGKTFLESLDLNPSECEEKNDISGSGELLELENEKTEFQKSDTSLKEGLQPQLLIDNRINEFGKVESCHAEEEEKETHVQEEEEKETHVQEEEEKETHVQVGVEVKVPAEIKSEIEAKEEEELHEEESFKILKAVSFDSERMEKGDLPDLMALKPSMGSVISYSAMTEPYHRIILFGGVTGFLKTMAKFKVKPNVRTLSLLLGVSPPTVEAEEKIIQLAKSYEIQLDPPFFSELLKRRIFRGQSNLIEKTLKEMQRAKVKPDLICFGVMAFGCETYESGMKLLEGLQRYGYRANSEILYGLLHVAGRAKDFVYVKAILDKAKSDNVELSSKFISKLRKIVKSEVQGRGRPVEKELEN